MISSHEHVVWGMPCEQQPKVCPSVITKGCPSIITKRCSSINTKGCPSVTANPFGKKTVKLFLLHSTGLIMRI